jgi:hypothetical protein
VFGHVLTQFAADADDGNAFHVKSFQFGRCIAQRMKGPDDGNNRLRRKSLFNGC